MRLQAPRGTSDVLPEEARRRLALQRSAAGVLGRAGYEPFETPVFEDTELFARGVGQATDIVQKEMFTFEDKAGRSLTLRPEGTAGVCRSYVEHGMHKLAQPVKLWYWGPFFRHEAPQAGRFRQFTQVGAEALGSDDPSLDAELILLLAELIEGAGAGPARLRVSSLGTPETRAAYLEELASYLRAREDELSEEVRVRLDQNPLRAFDADHPGTRAVMEDAPRLLDRLDPGDAEHFAAVRALLDAAGMPYEVDSTLVRGLDYYTRTVFEFESERLGAQAALGGGGRYDRLVEELGGPATPGVGWAAGIERILLASTAEDEAEPRVYVALAKPGLMQAAFDVARRLRDEGIRVEIEQAGRSLKGQLRQADRIGARTTVILGDSMEVKDMKSREQREASSPDDVVGLVREAFAKDASVADGPAGQAAAKDAPT
jgi:histidyl-tRNA synthetase